MIELVTVTLVVPSTQIAPPSPTGVEPINPTPASDFLKGTYQRQARLRCQQERQHLAKVCRDYLSKSFEARIRAAQDRAMSLRVREAIAPEVAMARQRAENDLADLERTRKGRMKGLERLRQARHGPVRHIATALILPPGIEAGDLLAERIDPDARRRSEKAAEDIVVAYEEARGWECKRVGHEKTGFDVQSLSPTDPQTGYRGPVTGMRRVEVKGRQRGQAIRLTTNEWYKATRLGDTYWLYVVWNPLDNPSPEPVRIQNPVKHLDHAKREAIAARYYDIPAEAIEQAVRQSEV